MKKTIYIAYGSNLNLEQMAWRCPTAKPIGKAMLTGYKLIFRGCATLEPQEGSQTPVVLWNLTSADEKNLDRYEGYPIFYRKEYIDIRCRGVEYENAMIYLMNACGRGYQLPAQQYLFSIWTGYNDIGLDVRYLELAIENTKKNYKF